MESFNTSFDPNYSFSGTASLNNSFNTSTTDNFGNVRLSTFQFPNRRPSLPISPLWGQRTVRSSGMNSYRIQPIGTFATNGPFPNGDQLHNVLLCTLTPVLNESQRDQLKYKRKKFIRTQGVRTKRRAILGKMVLISDLKQRQLKRLQRQPWLKIKKQEVYEKWEKKQLRREYQRRRKSTNNVLHGSRFFGSSVMPVGQRTTYRTGAQSPFQCPLWYCTRTSRISRRDELQQRRKMQPSRLSCRSDKSRSPIIIRTSPGI